MSRIRLSLLVALVVALIAPATAADTATRSIADRSYLLLEEITPNPDGAFEQVYALIGDVASPDTDHVRVIVRPGTVPPQRTLRAGDERVLRLFHFNDMHNHLTEFSGSRGDTHRFSQMVKIVGDARRAAASNESVLFFSAGDDMTGTIFDELIGVDADSFRRNPAYEAYSAAGIDASVLGNHEFDRGTELLELSIEESAAFPVLSANVYGSRFLDPEDHPAAIIGVVDGVRVGIVGLTTVRETKLGTAEDPALAGAPLMRTLRRVIPEVARFSDVVIVLSHVGYNGEIGGIIRHPLEEGDVDFAEIAAELVPDKPTLVVGGHTHSLLNANGLETFHEGVPVLQAGDWGRHLGELEMTLTQGTDSLGAALDYTMHATKRRDDRDPGNPEYEQDSDYDQIFEETVMGPIIAQLDEVRAEVIGYAGSSPDITAAATLVDRYVGESAIANFMNDTIVDRSSSFPPGPNGDPQTVDIAVFNATAITGGVDNDDPITFGEWFNVMPYADVVTIAELTGEQLRGIIVDNAKRIVRPEELQANGGPLNPAGFISRGFLHFSSGVRYEISVGNNPPFSTTATNITLFGTPIEERLGETFRVAFGDYIIPRGNEGWNGGQIGGGMPDGFTGLDLTGIASNETGLIYRNEIVQAIRELAAPIDDAGAAKDGRVVVVP